ncbi:MAG TPA: hypothetical protein PLO51_00710, partial [Candidatus Micrarchaeota archaeon]|nr:hypothetical protein [Candidatus Micrarchaeota archaeon]
KTLLGQDVGELSRFDAWLGEFQEPLVFKKSSLSGKDVAYSIPYYPESSKRISLDEVNFGKKPAKIAIDDIKDMDSLLDAVKEQAYYCGNIILGNSHYVDSSANISNSSFVSKSTFISNSKYIYRSSLVEDGESLFGTNNDAKSKQIIRGLETCEATRCLEVLGTFGSSDSYYSFGLQNCTECMFCFNLRNKKYAIGNRELEKAKYRKIKEKLLEDMRAELISKKKLQSLVKIVSGGKDFKSLNKSVFEFVKKDAVKGVEKCDMEPVEQAFGTASKLILGIELKGLDRHGKWLEKNGRKVRRLRSMVSGREIVTADYIPFSTYPKDRHVTLEESLKLASLVSFDDSEIDKISFANMGEHIRKIAFFVTEMRRNKNENVMFTALANTSQNVYKGGLYSYARYCAMSFWPRKAEYIFGSNTVFNSKFCIRCYFSNNLSRCFEVDSSTNCSDSYYLHNCENVHESMFCFNAKNLRHAIGNVEVGKENFQMAKKILLGHLARELDKKNDAGLTIFDIGK